jgi:protein-L-isoaspartate O-methyltransferase
MGEHFRKPRTSCVGRLLAKHLSDSKLPAPPEASHKLCEKCLPKSHALPRFFRIRSEPREDVGPEELESVYDQIHGDYDEFWLAEAARPIDELVGKLRLRGDERLFEAGCGTGYATALLAERVGSLLAADLSAGMLAEARKRIRARGLSNVHFVSGDALRLLESEGPFDVVFSSWVLGYIPLKPFFTAAGRALTPGGRLAFIVHKENSPREPLEIFAELVGRDPSVLQKSVAFDFPRDAASAAAELSAAGLAVEEVWDGVVVFRYDRPKDVLDHLLKSGAGTAFYEAIDSDRRDVLANEFLMLLAERRRGSGAYEVAHEYVAAIATRP